MAQARLVVDGTMRRVAGTASNRGGSPASLDSAASFFRFVAIRAGLPLATTAEALISDYIDAHGSEAEEHNGGLSVHEMRALATVELGAAALPPERTECPVCFSAFDKGERIKLLPCSHAFCEACCGKWMAHNTTCPMCRLDCRFVNGTPLAARRSPAATAHYTCTLPTKLCLLCCRRLRPVSSQAAASEHSPANGSRRRRCGAIGHLVHPGCLDRHPLRRVRPSASSASRGSGSSRTDGGKTSRQHGRESGATAGSFDYDGDIRGDPLAQPTRRLLRDIHACISAVPAVAEVHSG